MRWIRRGLARAQGTAFAFALVGSLGALSGACATYSSSLAHGQRAFEDGDLERALAILRTLEIDLDRLSLAERTQYAYLRGTIDYRMGYRADARHWLALAGALETQTPGGLPPAWADRMQASLTDLNEEVYTSASAHSGEGKPQDH
jgi:hypothetical protein